MLDEIDWSEPTHEQALAAAGKPGQLVHRAASYHAVWRASGGVCCFALVAAHGALWANWYLPCARLAAIALALLDVISPLSFREKLAQFDAFTHALREINRDVMVATYVLVHSLRTEGPQAVVRNGLPEDICADMADMMARAARGETLPEADLRDLYERHFRWEQKRVVGAVLDEVFDRFTWRLMRKICLRPWVWFAYFRPGQSLNFRDFRSEDERVEKGLAAFDRAARIGWDRTERRFLRALWMLRFR